MITLEDAIKIHERLINRYGGATGIRDLILLESALQRLYNGFGEDEFYKSLEEKAAALIKSIVSNHPFIDGNKRSGYALMRHLLRRNKKDLFASQKEKYDFVIQIASGQIRYLEIVSWIESKIIPFE